MALFLGIKSDGNLVELVCWARHENRLCLKDPVGVLSIDIPLLISVSCLYATKYRTW